MILRSLMLFSLAGLVLSQECGNGWLRYQDTCFLLVSLQRPFQLARDYCQDNQAQLAVLTSRDMNTWLSQQTSIYPNPFWIGLHDLESDGSFNWVDGTSLDTSMANWAPNEPNNVDGVGEDCVEMYPNGKWNDEQCIAPTNFICSRSLYLIPPCDSANGWESFNGKCYLWVSDTKSITDATTYCTLLDGYVISINDNAEQTFANSIQASKANVPYWTGLSDMNQGVGNYIWQDGTDIASFSNWDTATGEPSNGFSENCAQIKRYNTGVWSVDACSTKKRFICERPEGTCASGWLKHGGQCYQFNSIVRTWFDSKYYCEAQGGYLSSILDDAENSFITANMGSISADNVDSMWFGFSDVRADGTWSWTQESSTSSYTNWAPGLPQNTYAQTDCAYMATSDTSGQWYQNNCQLMNGFVCKISVGSIVTPVQPEQSVGSCESGWDLYGDSCYYFPTLVVTQAEAQTQCQAYFPSANLVSIHSNEEQSFLTERVATIGESMWIGLHDRGTESGFEWEDGTPFDYWNWGPDEPNNRGQEDCVHMESYFYKIGMWNDHKCDRLYRFVCKMPKYPASGYTTPVSTTFPPSGRCGSGWIYDTMSGNCYKYEDQYRSWPETDSACHYQGGRLTSISGTLEAEFVQRYAQYYYNKGVNGFWIGLHDSNMEFGFQWSNGAPLAYLNWENGEPNDVGGEDCVEMYAAHGRWNDLSCSAHVRLGICKKNVFTNTHFMTYPNSRLDYSVDVPISNVWPEECAFLCVYAAFTCRSFNYYRSGRQCILLSTDKDTSGGSVGLVPEYQDPWDYYHRDFNAPTMMPPTTPDPTLGCNVEEFAYRGNCYSLVTDMYSFSDMQDLCELRSSQLVSIADASENNFIHSLMQTGNQGDRVISGAWLGLTDQERESNYAWTDGSPVTYTLWARGEPMNDQYNEDCVYFDAVFNAWRDVPCIGFSSYGVCKRSKTSSSLLPPYTGCPSGWVNYMSTCYLMVTDNKLSWTDARDSCLSKGGKLATINNKYDQAFLASKLGEYRIYYTGSDDYWIGLSDTETPGTYKWVDGSYPTMSAWGPGQPDDSLGKCVAMIAGYVISLAGLWVDVPCPNQLNYICEQPVLGATDTPYTQPPVTPPSDEGCDPGAIGYGNSCFMVYEQTLQDQATFQDARAQCQAMGGDLASFQSIAEEQYIISQYTPQDPDNLYGFWIGLNDINQEGAWQWSDGTALIYVNWGPGEPNDYASEEECVEMFLNDGRGWNDVACYGYRSWICEKSKAITPVTPLPAIKICPSDSSWKYVRPYCYYFSDVVGEGARRSWSDAQAWCQSKGGHLTSITSGTENELLMKMAPQVGTQYWIGLRQEVVEGPYTWSDGSAYTYVNWNPGEPNDSQGEEECAEINKIGRGAGKWNDQNCGVPTPFICKRAEDSIAPITNAPTPVPTGVCDNDYFEYFNRCYRIGGYEESDRYKWTDARDLCEGEGGNLVSIHNKEVQALLTFLLIDLPVDAWIGFSDLGSNLQFHWTDGETTVYTNWLPGEPKGIITPPNGEAENCVEMLNEPDYAGYWNDVRCKEVIGYICSKGLVDGPSQAPWTGFDCDSGYVSYDDSCYRLDTQLRTYEDAEDYCQAEGGHLASITDSYNEAFLEYQLYKYGVSDAWIGLTSNEDGEFSWCDGWPVYFTKWGDSEPSERLGEGCVVLNDVPSWDDTSCQELHPAICRKTSKEPPIPVPTLDIPCPDGWADFGGHCYIAPEDAVNVEWFTARHECQTTYDAELVSIHSKAENEFVRKLVADTRGVRSVWLGLTRSETGGFKYTDNTPVDYVHWNNGEPTETWAGTDEDCVEMYSDNYGKWNDEDCYTSASFVCKMDKPLIVEPIVDTGALSAGAITGIVIGVVVVVVVVTLVVGLFVSSRKSAFKITTPSDPSPTMSVPSSFDNALYVSSAKETKIQVDDSKPKDSTVTEA